MRTRRTTVLLTLFWLAAGSIYVWAALQQKERVNLSPTAGGQYAYLRYSQGVAEEGVTRHFGDRNRMPLYPALLALTYHEDWDTFVDRSAWFAIVSSLAVLAGVGLLAYRVLPIWPATAFTLMAGVTVFIHKASFVQAELLYYGLLLASWLLLCRVIRRPDPAWAAGAGVVLALTYLTKASALATLVAFVTIQIIYAVVLALRKGTPQVDTPPQPSRAGARRALVAAVIVSAVFLAVVYPYISNSKSRFGRYFYNVNSRFFMWCDSWAQAKAFANRYDVSARYPAAPPEDVPGPVNYWRTHSLTQILRRLGHGFRTLGSLALAGKYLKYLLVIAAFCVLLGVGRRHRLREVRPENWGVVAFSFLLFGGYGIAYAWYAQIAYGDRFVLSLVLPLTLALWWLGHHLALSTRALRIFGR